MKFAVGKLESAKYAEQGEHGAGESKEVLEFGQKIPDSSVVLVSNYCTIIVLVLVIMSVNNNSFS